MRRTPTSTFVVAVAAALLCGLVVQVSQARALGGWSALLAVGESSPVRPLISEELSNLVVVDRGGHDGQATFAVGLDPWLREPVTLLDEPSYRYRRILLPMVASAFGLIDGRGLLFSLLAVNVLGFAATALGTVMIGQLRRQSGWVLLGAVLNVGLWLSLQITSPDVLAMGLATMGLALALRAQHVPAVLLLAAGALAKEVYLLVPIAIAAWLWFDRHNRKAAVAYLLPILPLAAWSAFLAIRLEENAATGVALDWPLLGLLKAGTAFWVTVDWRDLVFTILSLAIVAVAVFATARSANSLWRYLILPWIFLALVSSHWVWDFGNNSLRVVAPLLTFAILCLADKRPTQAKSSLKNLPV